MKSRRWQILFQLYKSAFSTFKVIGWTLWRHCVCNSRMYVYVRVCVCVHVCIYNEEKNIKHLFCKSYQWFIINFLCCYVGVSERGLFRVYFVSCDGCCRCCGCCCLSWIQSPMKIPIIGRVHCPNYHVLFGSWGRFKNNLLVFFSRLKWPRTGSLVGLFAKKELLYIEEKFLMKGASGMVLQTRQLSSKASLSNNF